MQASWKRRILFIPPVVLAAALLVMVMKNKPAPKQEEAHEQVRVVRVVTLRKMDVVPRVVGYGVVQPARVWNAVAQVSGRVVHLHPDLKKGAILAKDSEIIRIDPTDYELAIRQARANMRAADAKLKELGVSLANKKASLKIEKQSLTINEREFRRTEQLVRKGTVAKAILDRDRRNLLKQRKLVLELENAIRLIPSQMEAQKQQIAVFRAQEEAARLNLERTVIRLPFDARIASVNVEITQFVNAGKVLASADSLERAEINAQIPQARFRALFRAAGGKGPGKPVNLRPGALARIAERLGMSAKVRVHFDEQVVEWPARVVRISDSIDPQTRTVGAIVAVEHSYEKTVPGDRPPLVKGMFVEVEIRTRPLPGQILIPRAALHEGRAFIVNGESRLEMRPVRVKFVQGDFALIESGLAPGDRVVVSDLSPAVAGSLLKVVEDRQTAGRIARQAAGEGDVR